MYQESLIFSADDLFSLYMYSHVLKTIIKFNSILWKLISNIELFSIEREVKNDIAKLDAFKKKRSQRHPTHTKKSVFPPPLVVQQIMSSTPHAWQQTVNHIPHAAYNWTRD